MTCHPFYLAGLHTVMGASIEIASWNRDQRRGDPA
jgi:hypothetical protein